MLAAEMAGLAGGGWRRSPDPAASGRACAAADRHAARSARMPDQSAPPGTSPSPPCAGGARQNAAADIAIVVSELMTNALRHALGGSGDTRPRRPIRLGLLQPGPCVLCAVADPSKAAPALRTPGSLAETGRGLHIICALSDQWGYTTPGRCRKGRVGPVPPAADTAAPRPGTRAGRAVTGCRTWQLGRTSQREPIGRQAGRGSEHRVLACEPSSTGHVWITI